MVEFSRRLVYDNKHLDPVCVLCGRAHEGDAHAWTCPETLPVATGLRDMLVTWLEDNLYMGRSGGRALEDELYSPQCLTVWAMATKTQGFLTVHVGAADQEALGTQFLLKAVAASAKLWKERFKLRDRELQRTHGMSTAAYIQSLRGNVRGDRYNHSMDEDEDEDGDPPNDAVDGGDDSDDAPHMMEL